MTSVRLLAGLRSVPLALCACGSGSSATLPQHGIASFLRASSSITCSLSTIRSSTPSLRRRRNRTYAVIHGPYQSGQSRHGASVRRIHNIASSISRALRGGHARWLGAGNSGTTTSRCSVISGRLTFPHDAASGRVWRHRNPGIGRGTDFLSGT